MAISLFQGNKNTEEIVLFAPWFSAAFMPGHAQRVQGLNEGGEGINSVVIFYHLLCLSRFSC